MSWVESELAGVGVGRVRLLLTGRHGWLYSSIMVWFAVTDGGGKGLVEIGLIYTRARLHMMA